MNKSRKLFLLAVSLLMSFIFVACSNNDDNDGANADANNANNSNDTVEAAEGITNISLEDLQNNLENDDWVIVDTRSNDAYNGWAIDGVARGGHIKGAVDFSAAWLDVETDGKDELLHTTLQNKGIVKEKNIVLYDANGKDANKVANYLIEQGFENVYTFDVKEWAANEELELVSYPNYEMIVPASWVQETIENDNNGKPYKIFEVSWGEQSEDYLNGHIPGSVHINTDDVEEGPVWNRKSDEELEQFALNYGITHDTLVILYGADPMASYRVAVILKYMGVEDVRVLNGGWSAWVNAGFEIDKEEHEKEPVESFGVPVPSNPDYIIDLEEAKQLVTDAGSALVDIRTWEEYIGETSGYDYIEPKGRPAGSVWGRAGSDPYHLEDYRNLDNTMRNADEIIAMWAQEGIDANNNLAFYCGTGWRAAEVLFYADVMGLDKIALYDGGWNEWSMDPNNPVEVGEPTE